MSEASIGVPDAAGTPALPAFGVDVAGVVVGAVPVCGVAAGAGVLGGGVTGAGGGGGYFEVEGALGSCCCCGESWATSPHGSAAAKNRINQFFMRGFIIAAASWYPDRVPYLSGATTSITN
jgi:hypothetical protein